MPSLSSMCHICSPFIRRIAASRLYNLGDMIITRSPGENWGYIDAGFPLSLLNVISRSSAIRSSISFRISAAQSSSVFMVVVFVGPWSTSASKNAGLTSVAVSE